LTVGKSNYDKSEAGLLIDSDLVLIPFSIAYHFPEVPVVIEGDVAAAAAPVDLAALQ
jgi:hypothetical protein